MKVFVCLDDELGICLNGRRISQDKAVIRDVCNDIAQSGETLFISERSASIFRGNGARAVVVSDPLSAAAESGKACFVEFDTLDRYHDRIDTLTVYRWNRTYPSDVKIAFDPAVEFPNAEVAEFPGNSHEKITKEVRHR